MDFYQKKAGKVCAVKNKRTSLIIVSQFGLNKYYIIDGSK
jgi:hypothetical protein